MSPDGQAVPVDGTPDRSRTFSGELVEVNYCSYPVSVSVSVRSVGNIIIFCRHLKTYIFYHTYPH